MRVLILDGHPDEGRLVSHLLDLYQTELGNDAEVERIAVRDLAFDPVLRHGYKVVQPSGFAFRYHKDDPFWDRLLAGRSADVLITTDTPSWFLRFAYGNPVVRRWRGQILGFCGFKPVRITRFGPVRQGGAEKSLAAWQRKVARLAASAPGLRRSAKRDAVLPEQSDSA